MMKRTLQKLLVFILCWPVFAWAEWPDLQFPPDARVSVLGDNMKVDGVPVRIYGVQFYQSMNEMKSFYKFELQKVNTAQPLERPANNGGVMLAQFDQRYIYNVHLARQTSNSSSGTIAIYDVRETRETPLEILLPAGASVLSDIESIDRGKYSRHMQIAYTGQYEFFKDELLRSMASKQYHVEADSHQKKGNSEEYLFLGPKRDARLILMNKGNSTYVELTTIRLPD